MRQVNPLFIFHNFVSIIALLLRYYALYFDFERNRQFYYSNQWIPGWFENQQITNRKCLAYAKTLYSTGLIQN